MANFVFTVVIVVLVNVFGALWHAFPSAPPWLLVLVLALFGAVVGLYIVKGC